MKCFFTLLACYVLSCLIIKKLQDCTQHGADNTDTNSEHTLQICCGCSYTQTHELQLGQ